MARWMQYKDRWMLQYVAALLIATGRAAAQFPFGNAMEGSEQLEAYITVQCAAGKACQQAMDVRSIYKHTHSGFPDYRLALGPHSYIQLAITPATGAKGNYSLLLHQGAYSTNASTAVGKAINVEGKSNLVTYGCQADIFASPKLYLTFLCDATQEEDGALRDHGGAQGSGGGTVCAKHYDLSFAIKKSILTPGTATTHLVPPLLPVILALPVQADSSDPQLPYDLSIKVESTFPENTYVSLGFLHDPKVCRSELEEALSNQAEAGWPETQQLFQRLLAPHGDTTMFFIAVRSNSTKRALVRLSYTLAAVEGGEEHDPHDADEDLYLRRTLIGDRCFARGSFLEASIAFQGALALFPDRAAAAAKEYLLLEAAGALDLKGANGVDNAENARVGRERGLYPLVRELGDALSSALGPLEGLRASRIRAVRQGMIESLALARRSLAASLAESLDIGGAAQVIAVAQSELLHMPPEAHMQAQWEAAVFFRRHAAWTRAARELEKLAAIDAKAAIVKLELAVVYYRLAKFAQAEEQLDLALALDASVMRPPAAVMHAEATLRAWGCGNASTAVRNAHRAIALFGDKGDGESREASESDRASDIARAHDVVAVAALCHQGVGGGYDGAVATLTPFIHPSSSPAAAAMPTAAGAPPESQSPRGHERDAAAAEAGAPAAAKSYYEVLEREACVRLLDACRRLQLQGEEAEEEKALKAEKEPRAGSKLSADQSTEGFVARAVPWAVPSCAALVCAAAAAAAA